MTYWEPKPTPLGLRARHIPSSTRSRAFFSPSVPLCHSICLSLLNANHPRVPETEGDCGFLCVNAETELNRTPPSAKH